MRVRFNYTQDDLADCSRRIMARSKVARSWRWHGIAGAGLLTGLIAFVPLYWVPRVGAVVGVLAAVFGALYAAVSHKQRVEGRLRRVFKEQFGDENDFVCEVEVAPSALLIKDRTTQITWEWKEVEEIVVTGDSVDIFTRSGGVIVRNRAFKSPDEQKQFVALAQGYVDVARQAESPAK
jgi:hypothetical protein